MDCAHESSLDFMKDRLGYLVKLLKPSNYISLMDKCLLPLFPFYAVLSNIWSVTRTSLHLQLLLGYLVSRIFKIFGFASHQGLFP
jgi:hypothetical protein